jgi:plasmid stabilization system protein ParE
MAGESRKLTVSLSSAALLALDEIWNWNAGHYGVEHADRYITFLLAETNKLATAYFTGKIVPGLPRLSYIVIRRRRKGHGHLAVYELIGDVIQVLHFFHSAQDWQTKMAEEAGQP